MLSLYVNAVLHAWWCVCYKVPTSFPLTLLRLSYGWLRLSVFLYYFLMLSTPRYHCFHYSSTVVCVLWTVRCVCVCSLWYVSKNEEMVYEVICLQWHPSELDISSLEDSFIIPCFYQLAVSLQFENSNQEGFCENQSSSQANRDLVSPADSGKALWSPPSRV